MIRRALVISTIAVGLSAVVASAQDAADRALAAEGEGRWADALRLHQQTVAADPHRADVWVRIADIEARLGDVPACVDALQKAAAAAPGDASMYVRLSQAYSTAGQPSAALKAIEGALALDPESTDVLRAHATLATWLGHYARAEESYRRLSVLHPDDTAVTLAFARVSAWGGNTDEAVTQYRRYLRERPDDADAWVELARAESWRGDFAGAVRTLNEYTRRFGTSKAAAQVLGAAMAAAGRANAAEDVVAPLLHDEPGNFELNLARTIALAVERRSREAFDALDTLRSLGADRGETRSAERVVRSLLSSTVAPTMSAYSDSDHLRIERFAPTVTVALRSGTRLSAGFERAALFAPRGSGLEQEDGTTEADYSHAWAGFAQKVGRVTFDVRGGDGRTNQRDVFTYGLGAEARLSDAIWVAARRSADVLTVSPRTIGLGLMQRVNRAQLEWTPTLQTTVSLDVSYSELSDDNHRFEMTLTPRRSVLRRASMNLDLGVSAYRLETDRDLTHGYYDPRRYEQYGLAVFPYWKVSENVGVSLSSTLGVQRDSLVSSFRFGGTVSGEATIGIYEPWMLKINGSTSVNRRLESGAYQGVGGGVVLVRRF